jgi:O-antigen/teichoic acid export membrane protein
VLSVPAVAFIIRELGPRAYGQWAASVSLVAAASFLSSLGLRGPFIRAVAQDRSCTPHVVAEQLGLRICLSLLAGLLALAACYALGHPRLVLACTAVMAAAMVLQSVSAVGIDLLQAFQRLPLVAGVNLIAGAVLTAASVAVVALGRGPVALSVAYLLGPLTSALLFLLILDRSYFPVRVHWNPRQFFRLLKESRFFAAQSWINKVSENAEGVFVPKLVGIELFSFFAAGSMVVERLSAITDGLGTALFPNVARTYKHSPEAASEEVTRFLRYAAVICLPILILVIACAGPVAGILFPGRDGLCRQIILTIVWALPLMFLDDLITSALNACGKDQAQARQLMIAGVVSILLALGLIAWLGLPGACLSWVLRYAVRVAVRLPGFLWLFSPRLAQVPVLRLAACGALMTGTVWASHLALSAVPAVGPSLGLPDSWALALFLVCLVSGLGLLVYGAAVLALRVIRPDEVALLLGVNRLLARLAGRKPSQPDTLTGESAAPTIGTAADEPPSLDAVVPAVAAGLTSSVVG